MLMVEIVLMVMLIYIVFFFISLSSESNDSMLSSYECGFEPMMGARVCFSYRFFLISILFLIFDVEITMLMPLPFLDEGGVQVVGVLFFMVVLMVGLLYEYYNGVLGWLSVKNF